MIKEQRNRHSDLQQKEKLQKYIDVLEEASKLKKAGNKEAADKMFNDLKAQAEKEVAELERKLSTPTKRVRDNVSRNNLPGKGEILGEKDGVKLKALDESYKEVFLETEKIDSPMPRMFEKQDFREMLWQECMSDTALYYGVVNADGEYVGYTAIKDISKPTWEVAIVLLPEYQYKGYGKIALTILFDELHQRTGEKLFRARVDSDNYASQSLFRKLGARTNGISEFMLHGEDLEQFQKENIGLIDEKLEKVAEEFCVDAEELLGHVLEYLIDWPQILTSNG